jgi:alpha-galactosidase
MQTHDTTYLGVWRRPDAASEVTLGLSYLAGADLDIELLYPRHLAAWTSTWHAPTGELTLASVGDGPSARLFRIRGR